MDFSLYFTQLSVGCIALLPVVPWRAVGKGYYVMMLSIGLGLLAVALLFRAASPGGFHPWREGGDAPLLLYSGVSLASLGAFLSGRGDVGARISWRAAVLGATAVIWDAAALVLKSQTLMDFDGRPLAGIPHLSPAASAPLLIFNYCSGALLLGSVLSAMLLGHWYLVVKDLPVEPLKRMTLLFFGGLGARLAATVAAFLLDPAGGSRVVDRSFLFVLVYGLFSLGSPIGMSWMIWGTVRIRSTQAATGILYGVTAFILMGEAAGRFVLIKTGFPL